jgi:hypothetical protein
VMVSTDSKLLFLEVWSQVKGRPDNRQTFFLGCRVDPLGARQSATPVTNGAL